MNVSILLATFGHSRWRDLAHEHALPSCYDQDPWQVITLHQEHGTLAQARNSAAEMATGDWLCFLDADDRLGVGYIDAMRLACDNHRDDDAMHGRFDQDYLLVPAMQFVIPHTGECVGTPEIPAWGQPLIEVNCACIGTLVPTSLFREVGGFREHPLYEDWDLWLRCVKAGAALIPVRDAVYCARGGPGGRNLPSELDRHHAYWTIRNEHQEAFS